MQQILRMLFIGGKYVIYTPFTIKQAISDDSTPARIAIISLH